MTYFTDIFAWHMETTFWSSIKSFPRMVTDFISIGSCYKCSHEPLHNLPNLCSYKQIRYTINNLLTVSGRIWKIILGEEVKIRSGCFRYFEKMFLKNVWCNMEKFRRGLNSKNPPSLRCDRVIKRQENVIPPVLRIYV